MNQGEKVLSMTEAELTDWLEPDGVQLWLDEHTADSLDRLRAVAQISTSAHSPNWGYAQPYGWRENMCSVCGEPCGSENSHIECRI